MTEIFLRSPSTKKNKKCRIFSLSVLWELIWGGRRAYLLPLKRERERDKKQNNTNDEKTQKDDQALVIITVLTYRMAHGRYSVRIHWMDGWMDKNKLAKKK